VPRSGGSVSAGALVTMDFEFCFRDHVLSHTVYKPGGVTGTSHWCLSSYHNLQSIPASHLSPKLILPVLWSLPEAEWCLQAKAVVVQFRICFCGCVGLLFLLHLVHVRMPAMPPALRPLPML
jgi:hypothetical protein